MKNSTDKKKTYEVPVGFKQWWEPWGTDKETGASVGGHPDAERLWARLEPDGNYIRRMFGIKTNPAWTCQRYKNEYRELKGIGFPIKTDFISLSKSLEEQNEFWKKTAPVLLLIGRTEREKEGLREQLKMPT